MHPHTHVCSSYKKTHNDALRISSDGIVQMGSIQVILGSSCVIFALMSLKMNHLSLSKPSLALHTVAAVC